jgi:hypothetical protein
MSTTQASIKEVEDGKLVTYSVKQNRYGNWYGYRGTRKINYFFGAGCSQEQQAFRWLRGDHRNDATL